MGSKYLILIVVISTMSYGQVGINKTDPKATLEISAHEAHSATATTPEGVLIPRVSRVRAFNMQDIQPSTLIYIDKIDGNQQGKVVNVDQIGFYYYNVDKWERVAKGSDSNLYNSDGLLNNDRVVTQGEKKLAFTASALNAFSINNNTFSVDAKNQRVGIGTFAPTRNLHVEGTAYFSNIVGIGTDSDGAGTGTFTVKNLANRQIIASFASKGEGANSVYRMVIRDGGNIGIGTLSPTEKLDVVGSIKASGSITSLTTSQTSDSRLKKDIVDNQYGLNEVLKLKTINYRYKDESLGKGKKVGFIAQDVQAIIPELVTIANDEMQTLSISYAEMTAVLTKALQEQQAQIQEQQAQIDELQTQIKELQNKN